MSVNYNTIVRITGYLLIILGVCFIAPVTVAIIYHESDCIEAFFLTLIPCLIIGLLIVYYFRPSSVNTKTRDGFLIVSLCWIISSLIGAVPMMLSGAVPDFADAFFEISSGFSTTGSSVITDIESLPKSILFWRSFTHWLGGMGIVVFLMALMPTLGIGGQIIASAETPGPILDKLTPRFHDTAKSLYLLYLGFTVAETILLCAGGMSFYDSLLQTFGTVGTGGFSNYSDSIAHFDSPYIQWVIIVFMTLCGINFNLYFVAARHGIKKMLKDDEMKFYFYLIIATTLLIACNLYLADWSDTGEKCIRDSAFQVTSIITTTGYATADYNYWPTFSKMLILLLMLTGACSSSTGGGVKVIRILVALKLIKRGIALKIHPSMFTSININKKAIATDVVINIVSFIFLYIAVIIIGGIIVSFNGFDIVTSFSAVIACVGNIGPGFELVGPALNFSIFSGFTKIFLSFLMIAGRLELFTFFMLFSSHYWNSNRA